MARAPSTRSDAVTIHDRHDVLVAHEAAARAHGLPPVASLAYTPRQAERTVLHQVVREHLEAFLATTARADPAGLPAFLEQEFRAFLECGIWSRGFARFQCAGSRVITCGGTGAA